MDIKEYKYQKIIKTSANCKIVKASKDGKRYIIEEYNDPLIAQKIFTIVQKLYGKNFYIQSVKDIEKTYLIREYHSLIALDDWLQIHTKMLDKVTLCIDIAKEISLLHRYGLIYNSLSISGISIDKKNKPVLTEFSNIETIGKNGTAQIENVIYISPEATGKLSIPLDIYSDLYSLGILMYWIFTHQFPFESDDISELMSMHIAKKPIDPRTINKNIDKNISKIIIKLLSKNPSQRYKSCRGLIYDLQNYHQPHFKIGMHDFSTNISISKQIYGREKEIKQLRKIIKEISNGELYITFIAGYSGVGKSTLVNEINTFQFHGNFLSGKFQQYKSSIPYFALVEAFNSFFDKLLLSPKEELNSFKDQFKKKIGDQGEILTSIFPKLEIIVGKQKQIEKLLGVEAENRFNFIFLKFIEIIATKENPLVLFLDDLQWTDLVSLNVLKALIHNKKKYIMLGLAYRDNEVNIHHPFHHFIQEIETLSKNIKKIKLFDLSIKNVSDLIKDSKIKNYDVLGTLIHNKTQGNSFFVHQFLKNIVDKKLLQYDEKRNHWNVHIENIENLNISANVIEFMQHRLQKFSKKTLDILKKIGAIGHNVNIAILQVILAQKKVRILELLSDPITDGLIFKKQDSIYFVHDKIQQACYQLNEERELPHLHFYIANILIDHNLYTNLDDLFSIVFHLDAGFNFVKEKPEQYLPIYLNAAIKSKEIAAYSEFMRYIEKARKLIYETLDQQTKFQIFSEYHIALHLNARYKEADDFFEKHLLTYPDIFSLKDNYVCKVSQDSMLGKYRNATTFGLSILENLGIKVNLQPDIAELQRELVSVRKMFMENNIHTIFDLLKIEQKETQKMEFLCELISAIIPGSFFFTPLVSSLLIFETIKLAIKNGVYESMGYPFSVSTAPFILIENNYLTGYEYAEFAMHISGNDKRSLGNSKHLFILFCWHWLKPLKDNKSLEIAREAFHLLLQGGDIQMSGFIFYNTIPYLFERGEHLADVLAEITTGLDYAEKTANFHAYGPYSIFRQFMLTMLSEKGDQHRFSMDNFHEENYLEANKNNTMGRCFLYIYKTQMVYMFKHYQFAYENSQKAKEVINSITGFIPVSTHYFYTALTYCRYFQKDKYVRSELDKYIAQLQQWGKQIADNWLQKYYLVLAEKNRFMKNTDKAIYYYNLAIKTSRKNQFTQDIALSYELFSQFWEEFGNEELFEFYIHKAYQFYKQWGAKRKLVAIKEEYPQFFGDIAGQNLDLHSIIKAQNTLAQETNIEILLKKMLKILLEVSGAEKCYMARNKENDWLIDAFRDIEGNESILQNIPLNPDILAIELFYYVIRTKQAISIDDIKLSTTDEYIKKIAPKSILVIPIINQMEMVAVIYLEHRYIENMFSDKKQEIIQLLSTQMAISLVNAQVYNNLEILVQDRTKKLEVSNLELSSTIDKLHKKSHETREALKELQKSEAKLKESNAAKDKFFSIIAHDLKGPVGSIASILQQTEKEQTILSSKMLGLLSQSSSHLYELLEDLLLWARSQNQTLQASPIVLNVSHLFDDAIATFQLTAQKKGISLDIKENKDCFVLGDKQMIKTVIRNLINNALKFTPVSGKIFLSVSNSIQDKVKIIIRDTGIGMEKKICDTLFIPGAISHSRPGTNNEKGTGMGLVVSKELVELNKGEIGVESEPGKGSSFWFTLPRKMQYKSDEVFNWQVFLKKQRILYIEDDPIHVESGSMVMRQIGVTWDIATSGKEGIKKLHQNDYTLIFVDINIPDINGVDIVRNIRNTLDKKPIFIALTSYNKIELKKISVDQYFEGHLQKPLKVENLKYTICNLASPFPSHDTNKLISKLSSSKHILVVDDDEINHYLISGILKKTGVNITFAKNGMQAFKLLEQNTFDVVLMDIQMPVMDGFTTLKKIRENPAFHNLIVIIMTASANPGDIEKYKAEGMSDYIEKPIKAKTLLKTLQKWIMLKKQEKPKEEIYSLPILGNVDVQSGLLNVNGDHALYTKTLKNIRKRYCFITKDIQDDIEQKNFISAYQRIHNFKGLIGTIGANKLYENAVTLEHLMEKKEVHKVSSLLIPFAKEVEKLMSDIASWSKKRKSPEKTSQSYDIKHLEENIDMLSKLLAQGNSKSHDIFREIKSILQKYDIDNSKILESEIEDYEFEKAKNTLHQIASKLKKDDS